MSPQGGRAEFKVLAKEFMEYCETFSDLFTCHRKNNTGTAHQYLCGLLQASKRNMERMEEVVEGADYEATQQFISNSPWNAQSVMDRVAREVDGILGGSTDTCLVLDESGFTKKGKASVGVARQYNGRLGKVDNCQVAVFGALCAGNRHCLVDTRLYLPNEWVEDIGRCRKVKVPEERIESRTKIDLAEDIVRHQREIGTRFSFICADGLYGNSGDFIRKLDDMDETFVVHVHADQQVYLRDPRPEVPERSSSKGRSPTKPRSIVTPSRVDKLKIRRRDWRKVVLRDSTEGALEAFVYRRTVWCWDGKEEKAKKWTLLIRKDISGDVKYCLSNVDKSVETERLASMEAQRYWVERSFQDGKSTVGMDEYQVRGWVAWHHHMAMSMMALLFILKQKVIHGDVEPLLSANDIKCLLVSLLPMRNRTFKEVLRQMEVRHVKRQAASENKAKLKMNQHLKIPK